MTRFAWRKSSYSTSNGGNCVEAAAIGSAILIRDTKLTASPILKVDRASWSSFLTTLS